MAKNSTTKTIEEEVTEVKEVTLETSESVVEMNEDKKKNTKKTINKEPLNDLDEIDVESLIPNVSYKDSKTLDMYEWDEVGHIEPMTFETLKNMWRNNKGYFKNMWLKPKDERVINKFGLTKTFERYEYLMDASNYIKENVNDICSAISDTPNGLKMSIYGKIKNMVINSEISDVSVIRALEKHLKIDLIDFLD
jgi:hypothetical protein